MGSLFSALEKRGSGGDFMLPTIPPKIFPTAIQIKKLIVTRARPGYRRLSVVGGGGEGGSFVGQP